MTFLSLNRICYTVDTEHISWGIIYFSFRFHLDLYPSQFIAQIGSLNLWSGFFLFFLYSCVFYVMLSLWCYCLLMAYVCECKTLIVRQSSIVNWLEFVNHLSLLINVRNIRGYRRIKLFIYVHIFIVNLKFL